MLRTLRFSIPIVALVLGLVAAPMAAEPTFGPAVNAFCAQSGGIPSTPYAPGNCALCHLPGFFDGDPAHQVQPNATEYKNGNLAFFCPAATNDPPVLAAIGMKMITEGQLLSFVLQASDPNGDALAFSSPALPPGATLFDNGDGSASFNWTPQFGDAGSYSITFVVSDDAIPNASAMETITVLVMAANQPPVLSPIGNQSVDEGDTLAFSVSATDPDGGVISLSATGVPQGASFVDNGGGSGSFSFSPGFNQANNYTVTFIAADDAGPPATASETITVSVGDVNRPPVLAPIGDQTVDEGQPLQLAIQATDPDADALRFVGANLPAGATLTDGGDGTASLDWTPSFGQVGNFAVTVTVDDDGTPLGADSEVFVITVGDVNRPPALAPVGPQQGAEGVAISFGVAATDPDGDMLTLAAANLPTGATFSDMGTGTGMFSWTPSFGEAANYVVSFSVTDSGTPAASDSENVTLTIGAVNRPPVLAPIGARATTEGQTLQILLMATDPDADALAFSAANAPQGSSFLDNGDGTASFVWTPGFGDEGNVVVSFGVTDDGSPAQFASEDVTITVGDVNRPPVLAPIGNRSIDEGQTLAFTVMASDPDGDALALAAQGLPAGATFSDNGNGTAAFSFSPAFGNVANYTTTFSVSDNGAPVETDTETLTISVGDVNRPPILMTIGSRTLAEGEATQIVITASDADADTLAFSAQGLPAGATFVDNGDGTAAFNWSPATTDTGDHPMTVEVRDNGTPVAAMDMESFTLFVGTPPTLTGFHLRMVEWTPRYGGYVYVGGRGARKARPGGRKGGKVIIHDADTGALLGVVRANEKGRFRFKSCSSKKWPCLRPFQAPCAIVASSRGLTSAPMRVANAPAECGATGTPLVQASAAIKKKSGKWRFRVYGDHLPLSSQVLILDGTTLVSLGSGRADKHGRLRWDRKRRQTPCNVVLQVNGLNYGPFDVVRKGGVLGTGCTPTPVVPIPGTTPAVPPIMGPPLPPTSGGGGTPGGGGTTPGTPGSGGQPGAGGGSGSANVSVPAFEQTVYPLTSAYCVGCHAGFGPGAPSLAAGDSTIAHDAIIDTQKVDFGTPLNSRLVQRLLTDEHYCWNNDCPTAGEEMRAAIVMWASLVAASGGSGGGGAGATLVETASMSIASGMEGGSTRRVEDAVIARYEFLEGAGTITQDSSGVAPVMDLEVAGMNWLPAGGLENVSGRAAASAMASRKLYDEIAAPGGSNAYSIEAWITPENIDQDGPARIVSYSRDTGQRNFTMGQSNYSYSFRNRSRAGGIGGNGTPDLATANADRDLQATQQHVVMTFDQLEGRRIYVNGVFTDDIDDKGPGSLDNWSSEYRFALGNELTNNRLWKGSFHFVAIHDRALSPTEIATNFDAGVGERISLRFDVSQYTGVPGSSFDVEVRELDGYSYLIGAPVYRGPQMAGGFPVQDVRVVVNGMVPAAGQAFRHIDMMIVDDGTELMRGVSVIAKVDGPATDTLALQFAVLGNASEVVTPPVIPGFPNGFSTELRPDVGIRPFEQINLTMATLTGVDPQTRQVERAYGNLREQLPSTSDVRSFVAAQQMAIFKLSVEYCDELVDQRTLRDAFFGTFEFSRPVPTAFSTPAKKDQIADALLTKLVGDQLATQPTIDQMRPEVIGLIDTLTQGCDASSCPSSRTRTVVKAACSAVLSSAPVTLY